MNFYFAMIAVSMLACAACAGAVYATPGVRRDGTGRALALSCFAYWGACQLFYHLEPDPGVAIWIARASAPGWVFLGPLCMWAFLRPGDLERDAIRRVLRALGAVSFLEMLLAIATPWVLAGLQRADWGYGIVPGPLFPLVCATNLLGAVIGLGIARRAPMRLAAVERRRRRWIAIATAIPVAGMAVTDVAFPLAGILFPPIAPALFAPVALLALGLRIRIGHSALTPAYVANEILELLPDGVALLHADGSIRLANNSLARMCGCSATRLEGVAIGDILSWSEGDPGRGELKAGLGPPMPVALSLAELASKDGGTLGCVLVVRDLREVADLRNRLVVSGRLAAVGELAAGIAHEINNPLAFVRSNLSQLEESWKRLRPLVSGAGGRAFDELVRDCDELIEESIEGVDRAVEIVRGVKNFAHAGSDQRELTDVRMLLEDVLRVASSQLRDRVVVRREYDDDLAPVRCAPQQLKQVFLNLVINAAQAVEDGGQVLVATRSDGDHVVVSVADDGCGIPPAIIDRIFDPFFTTKSVGVGTGLGLGIAHQIVASHDGEIQVESEHGQGSVFRVRLPAARSADYDA